MKDSYTEQLENVIKQMLRPINGVPLNLVMETITGKKVIAFDNNNPMDEALLSTLIIVAKQTGDEINKTGIASRRANEVGNRIENFVLNSLNANSFRAETPKTKSGRAQSTGYPDIYFCDQANRHNYLECKTYNIESIDTSLRSFYLSPSKDPKIIYDAHHFVLSYEIFEAGRIKGENIYKCKSWKILSIDKLNLNVKYEFNASNKALYDESLILAEGKIL